MKRGMDTHGLSAAPPVPHKPALPKRANARVFSSSEAPVDNGAGEDGVMVKKAAHDVAGQASGPAKKKSKKSNKDAKASANDASADTGGKDTQPKIARFFVISAVGAELKALPPVQESLRKADKVLHAPGAEGASLKADREMTVSPRTRTRALGCAELFVRTGALARLSLALLVSGARAARVAGMCAKLQHGRCIPAGAFCRTASCACRKRASRPPASLARRGVPPRYPSPGMLGPPRRQGGTLKSLCLL